MSGVSLRIMRYAFFFAIVMILGACVIPVDAGPYGTDGNKTGVIIEVTPPVIVDLKPELEWDDGGTYTPVGDGGQVTVSASGSTTVRITPAGAGYASIDWYCNGVRVLPGGAILTVAPGTSPFDVAGASHYLVTVVGVMAGGLSYSTWFNVVVN